MDVTKTDTWITFQVKEEPSKKKKLGGTGQQQD